MPISPALAAAMKAARERKENEQLDIEDAIANAEQVPAEPEGVQQLSQVVDDAPRAEQVLPETPEPEQYAEPLVQEPYERQKLEITGDLANKAVLVQLVRRMYSPNKLDATASDEYGAGNVNKHLFQGANNRVKAALSEYTKVYRYVKDNTVPWTTGVDMLNIHHYQTFTAELTKLVDGANAAVDDLVANWDYERQQDYDRLVHIELTKGKTNLAKWSDYPSATELRDKFDITVRFLPVPTQGDFRVDISEAHKNSLQKQLAEAEAHAANHVLRQMLEPLRRATAKLGVPIGEDGSVFRDSLIDNIVEVAERMSKVNLSEDPLVVDKIDELRSLAKQYSDNKDMLRNNDVVRKAAKTQIDKLCHQMQGLV